MERKYIRNLAMPTISGSYPTREAYESGLLLPGRTQSAIHADRETGHGRSSSLSGNTDSQECFAVQNHAEGSTCEFRDYCNQLYSSEFRCACATAWRKRTGIALPTSA